MAEYTTQPLTPPLKSHAPRPSWRTGFLLWIPAFLLVITILLPVGYLVVRALGGEAAIWDLVFRVRNLEILWNSLVLAISVTFASIGISLPIAWLTTRSNLPFKRGWALLTALPLVIPSYIGAYLFVSAMGPRGIVQGWLEVLFGIERIPSLYGFPGALYVLTMLTYPYILLSLRAALSGMDPAVEEAARSLGHTPWQTFLRVTLPQLRPALAAGSLLVVLYALRDFGAVAILRYDTFTRAIYIQYQSSLDRSAAAVLSLILILLTLIILGLETRKSTSTRLYSSSSHVRPPSIVPLGKWKWPAMLFCGAIALVALIFPALNLVYWLVRGVQSGEQISSLWRPSWNSLSVSLAAAFVTVAASLPISILRVRRSDQYTFILERLTYLGFALPGIVIALALVFFGANYVLILYQTTPMLIFAYMILFLPQAMGAVQSSLLHVHPNLEEAGRSLGKGPLQVFRGITFPLVQPGLGAGAALVFLTAMKELPATLILSPLGFKTLATSIWGAVSEAFFAQAAAPALLLILVSSVPMAFLTIRKQL